MRLSQRSQQRPLFLLMVVLVLGGCAEFRRPTNIPVTAELVKESTKHYLDVMTEPHDGIFQLQPGSLQRIYRFEFVRMHDTVWTFERQGQRIYFSRSDFTSVDKDVRIEVDIWLVPLGDKMTVFGLRIHKVNDEPWFKYEEYVVEPLEGRPA